MAALDTVAKFIADARVLLQDTVVTYRYPDADLIEALNLAVLQARLIRPDLFLANAFVAPNYTTTADSTSVIQAEYRVAFLLFVVGWTQLRDDEETSDTRAEAFIGQFKSQLLAV